MDCYGDPLPPGALARLGTARFRHGSQVSALGVSPDGRTVATASGHVVHLWEAATGRHVRQFQIHERVAMTYAASYSPDGKALACAGDDGVGLWDPATGKRLRALAAGRVRALTFSPDGKTLALGHPSGGLALWDVESGTKGVQLQKPERDEALRSLVYSPGARELAVGSKDTVTLWDPGTGAKKRQFRIPDLQFYAVAFSPDGKTLVSGCADGTIRFWETSSGKALRVCKAHQGAVTALAFSPHGKNLASGSCGPQEGGYPKEKEGLRLWDVETGKEIRRLGSDHGGIAAVAFTDKGKVLIAASGERVRLWDVASGREFQEAEGHRAYVSAVAYSPDGKVVASGSGDGTVLLWEHGMGRPVHSLTCGAGVSRVLFSPSGKLLASAGSDGAVRLWDVASRKELRTLGSHKPMAYALAFAPDGKTLASGGHDNLIQLWDVGTGRALATLKEFPETPLTLAFAPDGKSLAVAGIAGSGKTLDRPIRLWDVATGKELRQFLGHEGIGVQSVTFSPDGRILASAGSDGTVRFWDVETGRERYRLKGGQGVVGQIAFSPDGRTLAGGGWDAVRLWEVASAEERRSFAGHYGGVTSVAFAPDAKSLASGSGDTTVLVWQVGGAARQPGQPAPSAEELAGAWRALAGVDAGRAHRAVLTLAAVPEQSVPFLRNHLRPASADVRAARLIADLDTDQFAAREKATQDLRDLGEGVRPVLEKALKAGPSPEVRRRLEALLAGLAGPVRSAERLQEIRAVEALEAAATPEARELLRALSMGDEGARLTREARGALERLAKRQTSMP